MNLRRLVPHAQLIAVADLDGARAGAPLVLGNMVCVR